MSTSAVHNVLRIGALALSLGSLAVVLALVQLARLVVCRADSRARQRPDSVAERSATTGPVEDRDGARLRVDSGTFGR